MSGEASLSSVLEVFLSISLLAFGGVAAVLPEIERQAVGVHGWLNGRELVELYAVAQIAPGPNMLVVSLIGFKAAGAPGALVATLALIGPTCILAYVVTRVWDHFRSSAWRDVVQRGIAPITAGLIASSAFLITRSADHSIPAFAITGAVAYVATATRINPLLLFAAAAVLGVLGLV